MSKDSQHYVPQGYLRKFTIEGQKSLIWEYDKATEKISNEPKSVRQICTKFQYYMQEDENGNLDKGRMENAFSRYVEDPGIRAINAIPDIPKANFTLSAEQKGALAFFIAILFTRGPAFRDGVKKFHEILVKKVGRPIIEKSIKTGECPEILKKEFDSKDIWEVLKVDVKNWVSLEPMIEMARVGASVILQKTWNFLRPDDGNFFVTSDNPFIFIPPFEPSGPYRIGPFHPMAKVIVPLRKNLALVVTNPATKEQSEFLVKRASKRQNSEINDNIVAAALRYIYAPVKSRNLLKVVIKFKSYSQKLQVD
jgi:hypothetical protein